MKQREHVMHQGKHMQVNKKLRTRWLTCVSYVPHGVLEGPDDGIQHQLELRRRDGEKSREAVRVHCLQQVEEVCPVLWELLKVLNKCTNIRLNISTHIIRRRKRGVVPPLKVN